MPQGTPFEFDISAAADKKRRNRARSKATGAVETSSRPCSREGCNRRGRFRAPRSPDNLSDVIWFCQKHIREYNLNWDFFKFQSNGNLGDGEEQEGAGQRMSTSEKIAWARLGIEDPFEILGEHGTRPRAKENARSRRFSKSERRALKILDISGDVDLATVRRAFTALVKDLHPDLNGGDRTDEARLQEVVWAWSQLKECRSLKD
ncbi:MAG: molecular chaperone DnaJ [Albidovulum sp.]|nr:molecular chaperone DnaJ [Albidovulum sp.]MDE0531392.1 molecular chaperone DnaJ [Albidovulum sp.]